MSKHEYIYSVPPERPSFTVYGCLLGAAILMFVYQTFSMVSHPDSPLDNTGPVMKEPQRLFLVLSIAFSIIVITYQK